MRGDRRVERGTWKGRTQIVAGGASQHKSFFHDLMSQNRPGYQSKFSSKGAYDALLVEDLPSDDEEDAVVVEPEEPSEPEPAPAAAPASVAVPEYVVSITTFQ